ncbi:hypothetical protein [Roseicyclus persicicus]|uniref:Uncharacterized protein n=1 Tax=Roseicyclus persicicus TaxID=2650661 RepID=A0A7X6GX78_9RHOB|nr:hypothetical protein [Roseibacterium persicicum]NKX42971.1 hypothetical protein [Roseibacterium persicicum]
MSEHTPNPVLVRAMTGFFWAMAASALAFWVGGVVWPGGLRGLIAALGPGLVAGFGALHIPAAIAGILLWQWQRHGMPARRRVLLEAATAYFGLAVVLSIFLNFLLVTSLDSVVSPAMPPSGG